MKIMIITGPDEGAPCDPRNINSEINGMNASLAAQAVQLGITCEFFQGRGEGELVSLIQSAWNCVDGIILNAGMYAHYSIAIRDAIASVEKVPVIEVHSANLHSQEDFRHFSMLSPVCKGVITGFGKYGYCLALQAFAYDNFKTRKM